MICRIIYAFKNINYWLCARHKKGHGIHSPFIYDLIKNVLTSPKKDQDLTKILKLHLKYRKSKQVLSFKEIGAGSKYGILQKTNIGQIVRRSSVNPKYGSLIYRLTDYFHPREILELGTSVGISTAYIAQAAPGSKFMSIEGVAEKKQVAQDIATELQQHTQFIHGDFSTLLPSVVEKYDRLDFVFFDGNHQKKHTLNYFEACLPKAHNETLFIFDDIHWSTEMEEAWEHIKNHPRVKVSIDLFRMGLIFFRKELSKQDYVIKF